MSSQNRTVSEFKTWLEARDFAPDNIILENVDGDDTNYYWDVTDTGISDFERPKNCFTSDAKIRIWKDVPTPAPVVDNSGGSSGGGSQGLDAGGMLGG